MKRPERNEHYEGKKRRVRHKPSSSTVMPDKRIRTDLLEQIKRNHYVSEAGVDYDSDEVDRLLILRYNKIAERKNAKELREFEELERLKQDGKIVDDGIESTLTEREVEENFDDCIF